MPLCFFVSDLHGNVHSYRRLFDTIVLEKPAAVFFGGDLFPAGIVHHDRDGTPIRNFVNEYFLPAFRDLVESLGNAYPKIFIILGNDDLKVVEAELRMGETAGLWEYIHCRRVEFGEFPVYGYAYVPPTPFQLKDWERYDVSRYLEPGCIAPEDGWHSFSTSQSEIRFATIEDDLQELTGEADLSDAIFLFHSPPYQTHQDRAALDGRIIDHVQVDVHVGSIAIRRLIEKRQPMLTLHGHIHESTRLSGKWVDHIGRTRIFSAAHEGPELALVRFDPSHLDAATRELIR